MIKRCAGVIALGLAVVACGGDEAENLTGLSRQEGGTEKFCSATAASFDGMASFDAGDPDSASVLANDVERMRDLAPDDAPESFDEFGEAYSEIVEGLAVASTDPSNTDVRDDVLDAYAALLDTDTAGLTAWLTERCSDDLGDAWTDGFPVVGGTTATDSSPAPADGSETGTISLGSDPADVAPSTSTVASSTTTTTTTVPVVTNDVLGDLRPTGTYLAASYAVNAVVATNADLLSYVDGAPIAGEPPLVIATIFVETDDYPARVSRSDFKLTGPDGRARSAAGMFDERGQLESSIGLETRDSTVVGVWFEVDSLLSDVDGWSIVVDGGGVPAPIALDAVAEQPYPSQLEIGSSAEVTQPNTLGNCDPVTYRAEVTAAAVRLEADNGFVFGRAASGRRYVNGSVNMTNIEAVTNTPCDDGAPVFSYDYRLLVDGRSIASSHGVGTFSHLAPGTDRARGFTFEIPSDATKLQLVGLNDEVIASWDVDLPVIAGE